MEEKTPNEMEMAKKTDEKGKKEEKKGQIILMNKITEEKLEKYFELTGSAIKKVKFKEVKEIDSEKIAEEFLDTAKRYFEDAKHFREKEDIVTAFAALNYAHGWLDAGARLGVFDVGDSRLFAI